MATHNVKRPRKPLAGKTKKDVDALSILKDERPPMGKSANESHGVYDTCFTPEELALDERLGDVDLELRISRLRLRRAIFAEQEQARQLAEEKLDLDEIRTEQIIDADGKPLPGLAGHKTYKKTFKRTNFGDIFDRLMARIESLEKTRHWLLYSTSNGGPEDKDNLMNRPIGQIKVTVVQGKAHEDPEADG